MAATRIPRATYRLQFHQAFGFSDAKALVPYLHQLGISDLYASPIFQARAGSMHGYDVVEPLRLNRELGTAEDFDAVARELRRLGMGWLQDIVPNHMAYDGENRMLMDVLENGPASPYANYFDIEWNHPYESIRGKVLAPFLGQIYGECLENGEIDLKYDQNGLSINYYNLRYPLNIESYSKVLGTHLGELRRKLGGRHPDCIKLLGVLYALKNLPSTEESRERADQIMFVKSMLWELYESNPEIKIFIDEHVQRFNGKKGNPESFNALDQLLAEQYFRLSYWKVATEEINYRRFFNINELISLRMEDEKVFAQTHPLIFKLIEEGKITGLRIDHIDGLYDPLAYLRRIQEKTGPFYVVVEKILDLEEELPDDWPVGGTTGYDFTNFAAGLFCNRKNKKKFSDLYTRFTSFSTRYEELVSEKKRLIIGKHMAGDVDGLAHLLKNVSSRDRFGGDITLYGLKRALVEVLTFFPVYRSYISQEAFSEIDRRRITEVLRKAKEMNPGLLHELQFIERFLLLDSGENLAEEEKRRWVHFIMRLQQLTGPLMAKGFEDTTLYIYSRLLSLNEVGGDPRRFGISLEEFHEFNKTRARFWPHTLNATSTHDTKRGEDVRSRIHVLSEIPEEWERNIRKWSRINKKHKTRLKDKAVPDSNDEYFLYQSLLGAFPFVEEKEPSFLERVKSYMIKAVREAKVHTEWVKPDDAYEQAFMTFIEKVLEPRESNRFLQEFLPFLKKIASYGMLNSLSQTLLKILSPGLPDFYQGTELWDLTFVDPDNRRPVDFKRRMKLLATLQRQEAKESASLVSDLLAHWDDGRIKLYVTYKALHFRRDRKELFEKGEYLPLYAAGKAKEHVCTFAKRKGDTWALVVVPRFVTKLTSPGKLPLGGEVWGTSAVPLPRGVPNNWINIFTGDPVALSGTGKKKMLRLRRALRSFPLALLAPAEKQFSK